MRIPKGSKYIRIPKSIEGKSHQFFIFHGDELSEVISTSAEKRAITTIPYILSRIQSQ